MTKWTIAAAVLLLAGIAGAAEQNELRKKRTLTQVSIDGNASVPDEDLLKDLQLKIGKPTTQEKLQEAFHRLRSAYVNRGFLDVRMSTTVTATPTDLSASIQIEEGLMHRLRELTISGNKEISTKNIRREFEIKSGDPFSPVKFSDASRRLYATGCFDFVDISMSTAATYAVDVAVRVRERNQRFIKGGAGYGTETKERLSLGIEDQNFFGGSRRADITYTHSGFLTQPEKFETGTLEATLNQPYIFGSRMDGQFSLQRSRKFREAYDSVERKFQSSFERRLRPGLSLRATYRLNQTELTRASPEAETPEETSVNAIGLTPRFDNTDDPFLPKKGWRTIGFVEEGLHLLKEDVGFHKFETRVGRFDTIDSGWTFFEGIQFGVLVPRSGQENDEIPINERFFLGGANSVRGYSERTLGPKDEAGDPLGGNFFIVTNVETRHKIYKKVFGVLFWDMGNLFDDDRNAEDQFNDLDDLKHSVGTGIRLHSPVGAIRLEGGYQLNPEGSTHFEDRTALHFSIGEVF